MDANTKGRGVPAPDWDLAGQERHPVVLTLACIRLADQIVTAVWHHGYPHPWHCPQPGCAFAAWSRVYNGGLIWGTYALVLWRRHVRLGAPMHGSRAARTARQLCEGVPLWEAEHSWPSIAFHHHSNYLEATLAELRTVARRLGLPRDPPVLGEVRRYLAGVLGEIGADPLDSGRHNAR